MIGSGLKKLAAKHNMTVKKGVAYGNMQNYATTLSEGAGYKLIQITTTFPEQHKVQELLNKLNEVDLQKEYRVTDLQIHQDSLIIIFHDNPGTMKKLEAFIEFFFPLLKESGATPYNICTECLCEITSGSWKLINNGAFYLHDSCAEKIKREILTEADAKKQEDTGSYVTGFLGAILGASVGSIVWAILLSFGYIASIAGFAIGWCAQKGYSLLHGKNGKGKIAILILSILFGVLLGTVGGEAISLVGAVVNGELAGYALSDIPFLILLLLLDSGYLTAVGGNILMGILFAALGVFTLIRNTKQEVSETKVIDL